MKAIQYWRLGLATALVATLGIPAWALPGC
jgi:hypothetical protein